MTKFNAMQAFSENVKFLLTVENLTIQELADRCDMRRSYLSRLIHGHHSPSLDVIEKIANSLGVKPHEIITPEFSKKVQMIH
jgi:transcriptional regulator with XRE-family HTH domain